jgi:hypothetical protein
MMTANELANYLFDITDAETSPYHQAATMLIQQQSEIENLKRLTKEPTKLLVVDDVLRQAGYVKAKTLTDEEIWEVINRTAWVGTEEEIRFKIAEAILRKAQEK